MWGACVPKLFLGLDMLHSAATCIATGDDLQRSKLTSHLRDLCGSISQVDASGSELRSYNACFQGDLAFAGISKSLGIRHSFRFTSRSVFPCSDDTGQRSLSTPLSFAGPDAQNSVESTVQLRSGTVHVRLYGSVLHLRGDRPVAQPVATFAPPSGPGESPTLHSALLFNGEVFSGLHVS